MNKIDYSASINDIFNEVIIFMTHQKELAQSARDVADIDLEISKVKKIAAGLPESANYAYRVKNDCVLFSEILIRIGSEYAEAIRIVRGFLSVLERRYYPNLDYAISFDRMDAEKRIAEFAKYFRVQNAQNRFVKFKYELTSAQHFLVKQK